MTSQISWPKKFRKPTRRPPDSNQKLFLSPNSESPCNPGNLKFSFTLLRNHHASAVVEFPFPSLTPKHSWMGWHSNHYLLLEHISLHLYKAMFNVGQMNNVKCARLELCASPFNLWIAIGVGSWFSSNAFQYTAEMEPKCVLWDYLFLKNVILYAT